MHVYAYLCSSSLHSDSSVLILVYELVFEGLPRIVCVMGHAAIVAVLCKLWDEVIDGMKM